MKLSVTKPVTPAWRRPYIYTYEYLWPLSAHLPCASCGRTMEKFLVLYEGEVSVIARGVGYPSCSHPKCAKKLKTDLMAWHYRATIAEHGPTIWDRLKPRFTKRDVASPFTWDWRMMKEWHEQRCPMEHQLGC